MDPAMLEFVEDLTTGMAPTEGEDEECDKWSFHLMGLLESKRDEYSGYGSIKLGGLENRAGRYKEAMMARSQPAMHDIASPTVPPVTNRFNFSKVVTSPRVGWPSV